MLACVAGSVDAIAFMTLGRIFPANITGDTVLLAINLARGDSGPIERTGTALLAFCVGVLLGAWYLRRRKAGWHRHVSVAFGTELVVLVAIAIGIPVLGPHATDTLPILALGGAAALAMGVQSSVVRHLRVSHLRTTFVSGPLVEMVAGWIDRAPASGPREPPRGTFLAVYVCYFGSALLAAFVSRVWPEGVMLLPVVGLAALFGYRVSVASLEDAHG